jgi:MoCo/4Fe-4S cofactor protein with predicted Tat translocation signal
MSHDLDWLRRRLAAARGKQFWRGLEELAESDEMGELLGREFPERASEWTDPVTRRQFLTLMGASLALAGVAGCGLQPPAEKIMPYVRQPEAIIPGQPLFFATAMTLSGIATGLLAESHEGRPTKVEGNPDHPACPSDYRFGPSDLFAQASVLGLYDPDRSQGVTYLGQPAAWNDFLSEARKALASQRSRRGTGLRVLTETVGSPTLARQLRELQQSLPEMRWHQYEPVNRDHVAAGVRQAFGEYLNPVYNLAEADVILSLDADFLSCGPGHLRYARDFAAKRHQWRNYPTATQADRQRMERYRLYVVECMPTNTGLSADNRLPLRASDIEWFARAVAGELQRRLKRSGGLGESGRRFLAADLGAPARAGRQGDHSQWIKAVADDLLRKENRGRTLILAGEQQPPAVHALAHAMNAALGNVGRTVGYTEPVEARPTDQLASLRELASDMEAGRVEVLLILGGNPVYTAPADLEFANHLMAKGDRGRDRVPLRIHLGLYQDETAVRCHWHLPEAHYLEAWSDARAYDGTASIVQPLIAPLYGGRSAHEVLAALAEEPERLGYEIVRDTWRDYWQKQRGSGGFEQFWRTALHDGLIKGTRFPSRSVTLQAGWAKSAAGAKAGGDGDAKGDGELEIVFRPDPTIYDGRFANNGWLQELPKPVTRLTWDNAVFISPRTAKRLGLIPDWAKQENRLPGPNGGEHGQAIVDLVELILPARKLDRAPLWVVAGHADGAVTVHLGHGRERAGRVGTGVGFDAYRLRSTAALWSEAGVQVRKVPGRHTLACVQMHHRMEGRDPVQATTLREFGKHPEFARRKEEGHAGKPDPRLTPLTLYNPDEHRYEGYKWAMAIDLTACTGCSACVVACQAENNIPVVGKTEVTRGREMHWLRIDHYIAGDAQHPERMLDNPRSYFQPVPCMHCEEAPCELVCPVAATVHSHDGLNDMVYNRCVGTRYCSNNCPYKVRRFNFLQYTDYATQSLKLLYNPDVTVRSRGVMEKCTYCVQRIRQAEIAAKKEDRPVRDGEVLTACQAACPTGAIVFGDVNTAGARVGKLKELPLDYSLLAELNTRPRTTYLAALRNSNPDLETRDGER